MFGQCSTGLRITTWLRTGVAHDIVRPLSNVAEIPASPARGGVELLAGQVRG